MESQLTSLADFFNTPLFSDVTVLHSQTGQESAATEYKCHKVVLAAGSQFLKERFQKNPDLNKITLPLSEDAHSVQLFFKYLYANQNEELLMSSLPHAPTLFQLTTIAQQLRSQKLENFLRSHMGSSYLDTATSSGVLLQGIKDKELVEKGKETLKANFEETLQNEDEGSGIEALVKLPYDAFKELCEAQDLNVKEEGVVLKALTAYLKKREDIPPEVKPEEGEKEAEKEGGGQEEGEAKQGEEAPPPEAPAEGEEQGEEAKAKKEEEEANAEIESLKKKYAERVKMKRLTEEEKLALLKTIRYSQLSHPTLKKVSANPLFSLAKDYVLQGLSARLKAFEETTEEELEINVEPRDAYKMEEQPQDEEKKEATDFDRASQQEEEKLPPPSELPGRSTPHTLPDPGALMQPPYSGFGGSGHKQFGATLPNRAGGALFGQSMPRPPQRIFPGTGESPFRGSHPQLGPPQPSLPMYFEYQFDFDQNGVLFYLGSYGRKRLWQNPHLTGQVRAFASSIGNGKVEDFVGRSATNCRTLNEASSFFGLDLGQGRLFTPTFYSIRNRNSSTHVMMNWKLEGSQDKVEWSALDIRQHLADKAQYDTPELKAERESLKVRGATSTWALDPSLVNDEAFRYFRIVQISKNSSGSDNLGLSGFELYGCAKAGRWP